MSSQSKPELHLQLKSDDQSYNQSQSQSRGQTEEVNNNTSNTTLPVDSDQQQRTANLEDLKNMLNGYSTNKSQQVSLYDQSSRGGSESDEGQVVSDNDSFDSQRAQSPVFSSPIPSYTQPSHTQSSHTQPQHTQSFKENQMFSQYSSRNQSSYQSASEPVERDTFMDQSNTTRLPSAFDQYLPTEDTQPPDVRQRHFPDAMDHKKNQLPQSLQEHHNSNTPPMTGLDPPLSNLSSTLPNPISPASLRVHHRSNQLNHNITKLTVISYNLWFQKFELLARTNQIIKTVMTKTASGQLPDVIAFQEATSDSYNLIKKKMGAHYIMFDTLGEPPAPYGTVLAVNRETLTLDEDSLAYYDFPETGMGRKLMTCQVTHLKTGTVFHVLNTHLESLNENWKIRRSQMNFILNIIKAEHIKNLVLLGDFNICDEREPIEPIIKYSGLKDAWLEMGSPQSLKNTYDYQQNQLVKGKFRSRLDRILYCFFEGEVVIVKFKLLGVRQPASDHFGLLVEFLIKTQ